MATPIIMQTDPTGIPSLPFPLHLPSFDGSLGILLVGTFLGLILYGLTLHQAYHYARTYPGDSLLLKMLVVVTVILETVSSTFSMHMCYFYMVTNYFDPQHIGSNVWSLSLFYPFSGATMVAAQSFFARRLWVLGGRFYRSVVVLSCIASFAELAASTITSTTDEASNFAAVHLLPTAFALAMVSDLLLTMSLIHVLRRKRTGFKSTDTMIDILILYSINTGLLNGVFDLLTAIFAFAQPNGHLFGVFGIPGVRFYAITLLAALNSRRTIRDQSATVDSLQGCDLAFGVSFSPPSETAPVSLGARIRGHRISPAATPGGGPMLIDLKIMSPSTPSSGAVVEERVDMAGSDCGSCPHSTKIEADV